MTKFKRTFNLIVSALFSLMLLLSLSWLVGTAVAAPTQQAVIQPAPNDEPDKADQVDSNTSSAIAVDREQEAANDMQLANGLVPMVTVTASVGVVITDDGYTGALNSMVCSTVDTTPFVPAGATTQDVSVELAVNHTYIGDLTVKLQDPNSTILTILNRPGDDSGGTEDGNLPDDGTGCCGDSSNWAGDVITFQDGTDPEAETMGAGLSDTQAVCADDGVCAHDPDPDTGPGTAFSDFAGVSPTGLWTLCVGDSGLGDTGTFDEWALSITLTPSCFVETTGDNVTDFSSLDASALQAAVDQASPGDTLKVAGTCAGVQTRNSVTQTVYVSQSVTIQGGYTETNWLAASDPGTYPTLIDAEGNGRVVYIPAGSTTVVLDGLTLTGGNGAGGNGGGLFAGAGVIWHLRNSIVRDNVSGLSGGGIFNTADQFTLLNSDLISNTAVISNGLGGGLYSDGQVTVNVTNSTVEDNHAIDGGGIHIDSGGTLNLSGSLIRSNHADRNGGGVANDSNTGTANIINSTIMTNTAADSGGGIFNNGIVTMSSNSNISDNKADNDGGGFYNDSSGVVTIMNSLFTDNRVQDVGFLSNQGGGIYNTSGGNVTVMDSTLQFNYADDTGGAIGNDGTFNLSGATVISNTVGSDGGGIWNRGDLDITQSNIVSNTTLVAEGGALINRGAVTVTNSTLAFNRATDGGGIYNTAFGTVTVAGSTIKDNHVSGIGSNRGGAIFINNGNLNLVNSTLSRNFAETEGGAVWNKGFTNLTQATIVSNTVAVNTGAGIYNDLAGTVITVTNSVIAYNSGGAPDEDCVVNAGSVVDNGYNLVEDGTCLAAGTSLSGDPLLATLANNGGDTETHLPQAFSPVIDWIPALSCAAVDDQRGVARPVDAACDIGSVELDVNFAPTAVSDEYTTTEDVLLSVAATGVLTNDIDPDFGPLTAVTDTNVMSGSLTLNSDGSFDYLPNADFCGVDNFTYHANDGHVDSNTVTVTLNVTCVNDAPVAVDDSYNTSEDTPLLVIAPGVLGNDSDADGDSLSAVLDTDVMSGTLIFPGDGSFEYVPPLNWSGVTTFTYHADDTQLASNTAVVTITVGAVNDPPVAVADTYTATEDMSLAVAAPGVLGNDSDTDGDSLTAVLDTDVMSGSLTLNSDGSFDYTPDANFCGTDSFTYHANDGQADSNIATVTLDVTCVNDAPLAVADAYTTTEDVLLAVTAPGVLGNDSDIDGDTLTAVLDSDVTNGSLTLNSDGSFSYQPDTNFCGMDSFTYHANDGQADSNTVTVMLDVDCVNDAPVAVSDSYNTSEDTPLSVAAPGVLGNDSDVEGDSLTAVLDTDVMSGTLTLASDGSFDYTPPVNWSGVTTFTYHADDGQVGSNTAVVTITVGGVNDAPVAVADTYTTTEDVPLAVAAPGVLSNDSDNDGDTLIALLDSDVTNGSLTLSTNGALDYTSDADFCGTDSFTYHASDGQAASNIVTVTLNVTCVNDAPVAVADAYTTTEDVPLSVAAPGVLGNDGDVDGDSLTAVLDSDVTTGTLTLNNDGSFDYTPPANWFGVTTFTYHADDGQADSNTVVVTLTVTSVNKPPVAVADTYTATEDVPLSVAAPGVLANDSDGDGSGLTAVLDTTASSGTLVLNGDGSFDYTPDADFCGTDAFTYHANDGQADSNSATVTIEVACVNDAPLAADDAYTVSENSSDNTLDVLTNDSDVDGDSLSVTAVTAPANGTAIIAGTVVLYTPDPDFVGTDSFTYTISDGTLTDTATVTITVEPQAGFTIYIPFIAKQ